jgi:hypothetical protein
LLKVSKLVILTCMLLLLLPSCENSGFQSIEEAMQQAGIQYKQIYHRHRGSQTYIDKDAEIVDFINGKQVFQFE